MSITELIWIREFTVSSPVAKLTINTKLKKKKKKQGGNF